MKKKTKCRLKYEEIKKVVPHLSRESRERETAAAAGKKKLGVGDPLASEKEDDRPTD